MLGLTTRAARSLHPRATPAIRAFSAGAVQRDEKLNDLLAKFSDPKSPYYLAKGEVGPASPDDHTTARPLPGQESVQYERPRVPTSKDKIPLPPHVNPDFDRARATGQEWFDSNGFDDEGRIEWPCAWGESDMYRHINNVTYARYIESARMRWVETLESDLGKEARDDLVAGRGLGIILKEQTIRFRYPVTYPDSIMWACRPHSIDQARGSFKLAFAGWSVKANQLAVTADSTCVMYDYEKLRKGHMPDEWKDMLMRRGHQL